MTYFELVNFLDDIKDLPRNRDIINKLDNANVNLEGNVLIRFIDHLQIFLVHRINIKEDYIFDVLRKMNEIEEFNMSLIDFKEEINYLYCFVNLRFIPNENKKELDKVIKENISIIKDNLLDLVKNFNDSEMLVRFINDNMMIKEG